MKTPGRFAAKHSLLITALFLWLADVAQILREYRQTGKGPYSCGSPTSRHMISG